MKTTLKNEILSLQINTAGAELNALQKDGVEYLWQADKAYWARHAPVLFPVVGKLKNGDYRYNDKTYQMPGHGFARDNDFTLIEEKDDELIYELRENADSLNKYPFKFRFRVSYKLKANTIRVRYEVKNEDEKFIYFGVGAHPAFNVPLEKGTFEDYTLTIEPADKRDFIPLDPATGLIKFDEAHETKSAPLPLSRELFSQDALVYKSSKKMAVSLTNNQDSRSVKISWKDMPYFGLWSPYPADAPFVCIEPWSGIADDENTDGDLTTKVGINEVAPEGKFACEYTIEIN